MVRLFCRNNIKFVRAGDGRCTEDFAKETMKSKDIEDPSKGFQGAISHLDLFISNVEKQVHTGILYGQLKVLRQCYHSYNGT